MSATISPTGANPTHFRQPKFWVTIALYILLTIGIYIFLGLPIVRDFVEQNQNGFFKQYFEYRAGYGVLDSAIQEIRKDAFLVQQALALLISLILLPFRQLRAIALGILAVILTFLIFTFCGITLFVIGMQGRSGY